MKRKDEFYVGYTGTMGKNTSKLIRRFAIIVVILVILVSFSFSYFQKPAANSSFDFDAPTLLSGVYYESPYPMLRVNLAENVYKDIVLLGFGKFGANPYLDAIMKEKGRLAGMQLSISGNLIYYNGKTLLQVDESYQIEVDPTKNVESITPVGMGEVSVEGEIVDPKCYFGVMKPGFGKIHRSCASLCIAGGMPPVLVESDINGTSNYYLLTDLKGNPINKDIIPYIGQPSLLKGQLMQIGDWNLLKIDTADIEDLNKDSKIY